jgi:hypothetical protein
MLNPESTHFVKIFGSSTSPWSSMGRLPLLW